MARLLYVREKSTAPFVVNFAKGGWRVYHNRAWVSMTPQNTKMWDANLKQWVNVR